MVSLEPKLDIDLLIPVSTIEKGILEISAEQGNFLLKMKCKADCSRLKLQGLEEMT